MANRVLLGKRGSSDYGLWVSKPGANVLTCDEEDMLIDANRAEIVSQPLDSGTGTVVFSGTSSAWNYINTNSGGVSGSFTSFNATYDYVPILVYCFVDSGNNRVYPMYYEQSWTNTITTTPEAEPVISTSSGYFFHSHGTIYTDKFKIFARRYYRQNGTLDGFTTGTHTFYWAIFPVGEASVS
jgi:hypothetical protein